MIKHIWFDFSETIANINKEKHNKLRYETYAQVVGKKLDKNLIDEYEKLFKEHSHSNSAIFRSLGTPPGFWSSIIGKVDPKDLYSLADKNIPDVLLKIKQIVPISILSNIKLGHVLPALGLDPKWFNFIVDSGMFDQPKPALDGYYKIIELTKLPPDEILYIGDHVGKDILPAKKVGLKAGLLWSSDPEADYCFEKFEDVLGIIE